MKCNVIRENRSHETPDSASSIQACIYSLTQQAHVSPDAGFRTSAQPTELTCNGKSKMSALGAAMRKLVQICFSAIKHQQPYQPQGAI
jgi:transposase